MLHAWTLVTIGLLVRAFAAGMLRPGRSGPVLWQPLCVDVNRASVAELMTLPGIGPERAEAIVLHRVRHGPFRHVDDLSNVDGIGPETLAGLRSHAQATEPPPSPRHAASQGGNR